MTLVFRKKWIGPARETFDDCNGKCLYITSTPPLLTASFKCQSTVSLPPLILYWSADRLLYFSCSYKADAPFTPLPQGLLMQLMSAEILVLWITFIIHMCTV